jgi:lactoylglutathione lyase
LVQSLSLIVIRSLNPDHAVRFYRALGLHFERHRHGSGPEHYAAEVGSVVLEIYERGGPTDSTEATRLGFQVSNLKDSLVAARSTGGTVLVEPKRSPWGERAVVLDPDGHRVELTQARGSAG